MKWLTNAARVESYRPYYDYVVINEDGTLKQAQDFLHALVVSRTPHSKTP